MASSAVPGATACLLALFVGNGCGSAQEPTHEDMWQGTSLEPGSLQAQTEGERELLARLDDVPPGEAIRLGGQTFIVDEAYAAASGRLCRSVTARGSADADVEVKLACQQGDSWVFVPDVFGDDVPRVAEVEP